MNRTFYFYILASQSKVLYVGFTNCLQERINQHKNGLNQNAFTSKYNCYKLVYYEEYKYALDALTREKQVKKWRREKKVNLIESLNPVWQDYSKNWVER